MNDISNEYTKIMASQAATTVSVCLSSARTTGEDEMQAMDGLIVCDKELAAQAEIAKAQIERERFGNDELQ